MEKRDQELLTRALAFALESHGKQTRKGRETPYACHLLQVSGAVLEYGGSVELAAAGLLHDAIEDSQTVDEEALRTRFGERVARIVASCSDTLPGEDPDRKSPWKERKTRYLAQIADADRDTHLVVACDKLDNLRSLLDDLHFEGPETLERFTASPPQTRWYYETVRDAVAEGLPPRLLRAIDCALEDLESFIPKASCDP